MVPWNVPQRQVFGIITLVTIICLETSKQVKLWIHSQVMHIHCTLFERLKLQTIWPYFNIHARPWVVHCTSIHIPSSYLSLNMWLSQVLLCSKSYLWGTFHGTNLKCSIVPKTSLIHILNALCCKAYEEWKRKFNALYKTNLEDTVH